VLRQRRGRLGDELRAQGRLLLAPDLARATGNRPPRHTARLRLALQVALDGAGRHSKAPSRFSLGLTGRHGSDNALTQVGRIGSHAPIQPPCSTFLLAALGNPVPIVQVCVDVRPLAAGHRLRVIGTYVSALVEHLGRVGTHKFAPPDVWPAGITDAPADSPAVQVSRRVRLRRGSYEVFSAVDRPNHNRYTASVHTKHCETPATNSRRAILKAARSEPHRHCKEQPSNG
jgi:hypothetical protein